MPIIAKNPERQLLQLGAASALLVFFAVACSARSPEPVAEAASPPSATDQPSPVLPTNTPEPTSTSLPLPSIPNPDGYAWVEVARSLNRPLLVTNAGDGSNRLFVVGQQGLIYIIENGNLLAEPFLNIRGQINSESLERGLLGLAFHPNYDQNGTFFLDYTDLDGNTVISRWQVSANPNVADASSESIILRVGQPFPNHNGGNLVFGPDGYLYIGLGDGGSGGDPRGNGQNPNTLLGSILRIDVDGGSPYGIPPDNPFVNGGGLPEVWVYGLRNPWRFSFDAATGDMHIADVGQSQWEEVDFLPGGIVGGANFGWNYLEGTHIYQGEPPAGLNHVLPVVEYPHSTGGCSVTGGSVYRGASMPEWQGVYFYGDYCSGMVYGLVQGEDGAWQSEELYNLAANISSFGVDEQGEIYLVDLAGTIYQLRPQ